MFSTFPGSFPVLNFSIFFDPGPIGSDVGLDQEQFKYSNLGLDRDQQNVDNLRQIWTDWSSDPAVR